MSLPIASANVDFALGHNREYVQWLCEDAAVLGLQEAKDINLADLLPEGWASLQDTSTPARAGSCIAYRTDAVEVLHHRLVLGANPSWLGRRLKMLPRYIAVAHIEDKATKGRGHVIVPHFPPARFRVLQPGYEDELRLLLRHRPHSVTCTDANQSVDKLADRLGLDAWCRDRSIVGVMTDPSVHVSSHVERDWGKRNGATDHPAVFVKVSLPHPKEKHHAR